MDELLRFERVSKSFWRGSQEGIVLRDVDLLVRGGEMVVIWGKRAAGKTTLAEVAAGIQSPDAGIVRFAGEVIAEQSRGSWFRPLRWRSSSLHLLHREIGWVHRTGEASQTVVQRVALPLYGRLSPRRAHQRASALLGELGVGECAELCWGALTDGQRTLVALAGALVREPRLVIADDPTVHLNAEQSEQVMLLLRKACDEQRIAVLATVPDVPDSAHADQIGSLSRGRLLVVRAKHDPENVVELRRRGQSA